MIGHDDLDGRVAGWLRIDGRLNLKVATDEDFGRFASLFEKATVELAEVAGHAHGDEEYTGSYDGDVDEIVNTEAAEAEDQQVSEGEVEDAPEHVDSGRRQAFAGRLGEGTLERATRDAVNEMGHGIRKKHAAKEVTRIDVPVHDCSLSMNEQHGSRF
jgi:hypothetical protein